MSNEIPPGTESQPQAAAQPVYVMYPPEQETKIDLVEFVGSLWQRKLLIAGVTLLFVVAGVAYAFLSTPTYRAEAVLAPNKSDRSANLPAALGGLASLAGINPGASPSQDEAVATLQSRAFIEDFINDNNLLPVLFADQWDATKQRWVDDDPASQPAIQDGVQFFIDKVRSITQDSTAGLVTLDVEWSDPQIATRWAEELVQRINERLRTRDLESSERKLAYLKEELQKTSLVELRQAIAQLIESEIQTVTLARAETEYAFKVIDPPRVPKDPVAPQKLMIIVAATFLGGVLGVASALVVSFLRGRRA